MKLFNSIIIKKIGSFKYSNSLVLNLLNKLDYNLSELFVGNELKFKIWWRRSFVFSRLNKKEQKLNIFENSRILNYLFENSLINAIRNSYFINKLFNK